MSEISVTAKKRALSTKGTVNKLRREGNVPGIYYRKGTEPIPIYTTDRALKPLVYTSETHLINLKIDDGEELKSILKNVQFDPVSDKVVHFDLLGISEDQELEIEVPVALEGQAKGIKEGGVVQHTMHKLRIACLPADIPQNITIDIANLGIGDSVHVKDIKIEKARILHHDDVIIVSVHVPRAVVEPTAVVAEVTGEEKTEPEIISKGKQTEEEE
jgi:large subunit ribosomal protein L25